MTIYSMKTTDKQEFAKALKADSYLAALWDLDQWLRNQIKYGYENYSEDEIEGFVKVRKELHEILEDNNVDLHD